MQLLHDRASFTGLDEVSASLNLMTYLAAKTTTLRLGTAVMTLLGTPVLLAERVATWILSPKGASISVSVSVSLQRISLFGVDMVDADEIADRLEVIRRGGIEYVPLSNAGGGLLAFVNFPFI